MSHNAERGSAQWSPVQEQALTGIGQRPRVAP
jgi:hypothetical protein